MPVSQINKNYPEKLCTHYHYICMTGQWKNMNHRPITIVKINKHSSFFQSPMSIVQMWENDVD